jgi:AcrR family transcriptional regulator
MKQKRVLHARKVGREPAPQAPAPKGRDPERTRARILEAATREFARLGLGGARVDRIAERADANKRMLYYYFGDKEGLFRAVMEHTYERIRRAEQELHLLDVPPLEGVLLLVEFTWRYYLAHPEFLTLLNSENLHRARHLKKSREIRTLNSPVIATLSEILRRGEADGTVRAGVDALQLYISIAALCYFFLSNNHTLSAVFDRDLATPAAREERLDHMRQVIAGYLASSAPRAPVTPRRRLTRPAAAADT